MDTKSQQPKAREGVLSMLNVAIEAVNLAKNISAIAPAQAAFGSASTLLTMIRDSMANEQDYVDLGVSCADVCQALDRGITERRLDGLSSSVLGAIRQLTATVAEILRKIAERGKRNTVSRLFHAKDDKDTIAAWRQDLIRVIHVFNTELAINTHVMVADIHRNVLTGQDTCGKHCSTQATPVLQPHNVPPGELPPPPPRACFGRNELIERIVGLAESFNPIALVGAGGIGKTSVALAVLHHARIKKRFGSNRRFIRCDQFPASRSNFLGRLSKVIGAGVENPEDLTPLRPSLSATEMFVILDNAESILDPQGANAQEIYGVVEELSQFDNICLCITTRITTIPPDCKRLDVPTLSMDAAYHAFHRIQDNDEQPDLINDILKQLDFHPLSVTLLATVAHQNNWDNNRLVREWEQRQTGLLRTEHNKSLAATMELSLTSPMFQELGSDARDVLSVVAFFPQGVDENNLGWLFPTFPNGTVVFDKFCILSLTYRNNGFITMLAPLRDYLCPKDPKSFPLLCATKERYFTRMSVNLDPHCPGFGDTRWITSEDVNVEHLLDIFTSNGADSDDVWEACINFMKLLFWHKRRLTVLGPKIELLPDDHSFKLECTYELSRLFYSVGDHVEQKRLLSHVLELMRERGDDRVVARVLSRLSDANRLLGRHKEGIELAKEALEIHGRLDDTVGKARCLNGLACLMFEDEQLDAAEEAASRAIKLLPEKGEEFLLCGFHRVLGNIYHSKDETGKAIEHFETALGIASAFDWHNELFWTHYSLAKLFSEEGRLGDAHAHIEQAKSHAVDNAYDLGRAIFLQARIWYRQRRLKEAMSEALRALEIFEKLGVTNILEACKSLLGNIEQSMKSWSTSGGSDSGVRGTSFGTLPSTTQSTALGSGPIPYS
ncbi:hypothetical protein BJ322DRAFT_707230 [Thelephora terrestris]|uniref:TPR-like protein n=1 Tax=Thelephora terrestris TaxID=56493 RepID=A0A9P6L8W9_9AGAM|nr:hypothetical protein BJ322DRAFT_707230 [Thelephora terrestris]